MIDERDAFEIIPAHLFWFGAVLRFFWPDVWWIILAEWLGAVLMFIGLMVVIIRRMRE